MDLSTLSTGFSTGIVKKDPVFPRCFPLFPLSFPHFPVGRFIHGVLYRADLCENSGNSGPLHLFSERKSNPKIYFLQRAENPLLEFLPVGMKEPVVFHTHFLQKSACGKQRENFSFQQKETALSVIAARCHLSQRARLCCLYLRPAIGSPLRGSWQSRQALTERVAPIKSNVTSYSGTRPARSGSTGSSCRHPRW